MQFVGIRLCLFAACVSALGCGSDQSSDGGSVTSQESALIVTLTDVPPSFLSREDVRSRTIQLPYSGQLAEDGELANGSQSLSFVIDSDTGYATGYDASARDTVVSNGAFSVNLGGSTLLDSSPINKPGLKLRIVVPLQPLSPLPANFQLRILEHPDGLIRSNLFLRLRLLPGENRLTVSTSQFTPGPPLGLLTGLFVDTPNSVLDVGQQLAVDAHVTHALSDQDPPIQSFLDERYLYSSTHSAVGTVVQDTTDPLHSTATFTAALPGTTVVFANVIAEPMDLAGTDFLTSGGLTLANALTVSEGGASLPSLMVPSGTVSFDDPAGDCGLDLPGGPFESGLSGGSIAVANPQPVAVGEIGGANTVAAGLANANAGFILNSNSPPTLGTLSIRSFGKCIQVVGSGTAATGPARVYVPSFNGGVVRCFTVDPVTGALTPEGDPIATGSAPFEGWVHPRGRFLYLANLNGNSVSGFVRGPAGLTPAPGSPFSIPAPLSIAGNDKLLAVSTDSAVVTYSIDPVTGALTQIDSKATGPQAQVHSWTDLHQLVRDFQQSPVAEDLGSFVHVPNQGGNTISAFHVSPTGALTPAPGSPFPGGNNPASAASDPLGRYLYVGNFLGNNVSAYRIHPRSGALTELTGSPFACGNRPNTVAVDPTGHFVLTADGQGQSVSVFTLDPGGTLTQAPGSPFALGVGARDIGFDPTGRFVFVPSLPGNTLTTFRLGATGSLTLLTTTPIPNGPFSAIMSP